MTRLAHCGRFEQNTKYKRDLRPAQLGEEAGLAQGKHARQHRTAAARVCSTEVLLTSLSWLGFLHTVRFVPTGGPCGRTGVYHRSVTGPVDTRRLAQRCALRRGYEVRESRQPESRRQLRCRRQLAVLVSPARGISGKFTFVHRYVRVNSWTWLHPRVFELIGIRDL